MISSNGASDMGHQLEAKLTCIAVARFLGMEYIHHPMWNIAHGHNLKKMEVFLNLGMLHRHFNRSTMRTKSRQTTWVGRCNQKGWLRRVEMNETKCLQDGRSVYTSDNCWDRFYCHGLQESGYWYKLVPEVQAAYYAIRKPDLNWLEGFPADLVESTRKDGFWRVALHVHRRSSDGVEMSLPFFVHSMELLRKQFTRGSGGRRPLFRVQTDDESLQVLNSAKAPAGFDRPDVIIDAMKDANFELAFHRMVAADALIMSRSALSMAAAFIGNQSIVHIPSECWDRTALPHWTKLGCD